VGDLYLRSCAVKAKEVECSSAVCAGCVTHHRQQMRMRTLPNVLFVRLERGVNDGSHARLPVAVDGELSFPGLGANLVLAAVLYQIPDRVAGMRYACACAAVDGEFWYYDGDLEPCCLGPDVSARLPRHSVYCVYHVRGGAAEFEGVVNRVVERKRPGWRSVGPGKEDAGGVARSSGDGAPSAMARQLERTERLARIATLATEFYMDASMDLTGRVVRTFRDMYFERLETALPFFARVWLYRLVQVALRVGGGLVQLEPEGAPERVISHVVGYLVPAPPQGSAAEAFLEFVQLCLVTQVSKDEVQRAIVVGMGDSNHGLGTASGRRQQRVAQDRTRKIVLRAEAKTDVARRRKRISTQRGLTRLLGTAPRVDVSDSGPDAWKRFTPSLVDYQKCMARTWGKGVGGQCQLKPLQQGGVCQKCSKKLTHGMVTGEIPEGKLQEFLLHAERAARRRERGVGVAVGSEGCGIIGAESSPGGAGSIVGDGADATRQAQAQADGRGDELAAAQCVLDKSVVHADAADVRVDVQKRRGVDYDAARRLTEKAASRVRLHEGLIGVPNRATRRLTSADVARQAQTAAAAAVALSGGAQVTSGRSSAGARSSAGQGAGGGARGGGAGGAGGVPAASNAVGGRGRRPHVAGLEESRLFRDLLSQSQFTLAEGGEVVEGLPPDIADAICAQLHSTFGARKAYELEQEDWFCVLLEWRNFKKSVMLTTGLDDDALGLVTGLGLLAELMFAVSHRARENARTDVRRPQTTDGQALERLKALGYEWRQGKVWARNNCLADSLLQLLVYHLVIYGDGADHELSDTRREDVCSLNRDRLWRISNCRLRPRRESGREDTEAYLQHHVHAGPTIEFFVEQFASRDGVPDGGIELHVHTRFDEDVGVAGILDKHLVCVRRPGGAPLIMHLFCSTGGALGGYHYDPLFWRGIVGGVAGLDLTEELLIEEFFGLTEQTDEARRIAQGLEAGDAQAEEVVMDDPELAEAKRQSLVGVEDAALQAALDLSMAGLSLDAVVASSSASGSGAAVQRHAVGQDARGQAVDGGGGGDGGRAAPPCPSAGAGQARDARTVPSSGQDTLGGSEPGAGVRRVQRRVGHSQVYESNDGSKRGYRRLRRAVTRAPTGDQETDRAVSQGLLVWDEAEDTSTPFGDTGMGAFEGCEGEVTPPCPTGGVESEDCQSEGEPSSQVRQAPCYSPLIRRRTSLVQRPSSPALPPRPLAAPSETEVQPRGVDSRLPDTGEGYGPAGGRRQSARIATRNRAAAASLGLVPDAPSGSRGAPGQVVASNGAGSARSADLSS
jgi:hypothetical protein